ncbi:MAG: hypothetical protein RL077_5179 [Verrucomicrobiota bacterium]|jgi:hypothetical protein
MKWSRPLLVIVGALLPPSAKAVEPVNFSREILPILSDNCFACHGRDESHRQAELRLDTREGATAANVQAVVPGQPEASELMHRILATDPDEVMPPPKSHKPPLTAEQAALFRRWIAEGAPWGKHWAFEQPTRAAETTGRNAIDEFVAHRLRAAGMTPAPPAAKSTLLRRVSFDLTGLPPTAAETAAFLVDTSPQAYEKEVQRLLASPHFGERMAMIWLDAARYADTDGFQGDADRTNWPWRDWVVSAFNANQRFDAFTIEQFAGDLLPKASPEQILATCFHRNHMTNGEGGRDPDESRVDYVIDRINTVGTTWLGLTLGCTQCHSHKFDPISHADYYSLAAFFNSIDEDGKAGTAAKPYLAYKSPLTARALADAKQVVADRQPAETRARTAAEAPFDQWLSAQTAAVRGGFSAWRRLQPTALESTEGTRLDATTEGIVQASGPNLNQDDYRFITTVPLARLTGLKLEILPDATHTAGKFSHGKSGEFILTDIKVQVRRRGSSQIRDLLVNSAVADFSPPQKEARSYGDIKGVLDDDPRNGWTTRGAPSIIPHTAIFALAEPLTLEPDEELVFELRQRSTDGDANIGRFCLSASAQPGEAVRTLNPAPLEDLAVAVANGESTIAPELRTRLFTQFLEDHAPYRAPRNALDRAERQLAEIKKATGKLNVMVLAERPEARESHVLERGVWDKLGERVYPGVPNAIAAWPEGAEKTRLGLARWIVSRENPLTARVFANHLWQMLFGAGLVRTPEDFGLQGERPTHPELLDWLAVEFMESGWDVKHLLTLMTTSATYRQDSASDAHQLARDPENRLLGRGPRFRLPSWMLRDAALHAAGLLNPALGGPPVKPYQPEGVWEEMFMGRFRYEPSEGPAQYRRTLYAFWRRGIAPTFLFDTAQRRTCEVGVSRTNTPLQALTLLNDQTYLEASRALATTALQTAGPPANRLRLLTQHVLSRPAHERELTVLSRELNRALTHYRAHPNDATAFLRIGQTPPSDGVPLADLAAYTLAASLILNLDEAINHE